MPARRQAVRTQRRRLRCEKAGIKPASAERLNRSCFYENAEWWNICSANEPTPPPGPPRGPFPCKDSLFQWLSHCHSLSLAVIYSYIRCNHLILKDFRS